MPFVLGFTPSKSSTPYSKVYAKKPSMEHLTQKVNSLEEENSQLKELVNELSKRLETLEGKVNKGYNQLQQGLRKMETLEVLEVLDISPTSQGEEPGETYSQARPKVSLSSIEEMVTLKMEKVATSIKEEQERKDRALNLRIVGLQEQPKETLDQSLSTFFRNVMHIPEPQWQGAFRVGMVGDRPRQVIVKFKDPSQRLQVLRHKSHLKGEKIWINEDLTKEQYLSKKGELEKVKAARKEGKSAYLRNGKAIIEVRTNKDMAINK